MLWIVRGYGSVWELLKIEIIGEGVKDLFIGSLKDLMDSKKARMISKVYSCHFRGHSRLFKVTWCQFVRYFQT